MLIDLPIAFRNFPVIESLMIRAPSLEEFRRKAAVEVSSEDAEELRSQQGGGSVKSSGDDADKAKLKGMYHGLRSCFSGLDSEH